MYLMSQLAKIYYKLTKGAEAISFSFLLLTWKGLCLRQIHQEEGTTVDLGAGPWAGPRQLEAPYSLHWPTVCSAHCFHTRIGFFEDTTLREEDVVETTWSVYMTEPSEGIYINFQILAGRCSNYIVLQLPKKSLVYKFSWLLKLPPTNLECSVSFFGLSLSSMNGDQF